MSSGRWLLVIVFLTILAAAYGPLFGAGFSPWDDRLYIADNPLVRGGLSLPAILGSFTTPWENNWSPVFWIFLAAQVSLAGGIFPGFFHAVSVLLGLLNAVLLGGVARRFALSFPVIAAVVALFALHPLRVEAVAWISAQKHLLAAALLLISLLFYQEALRRDFGKFCTLSLAAFALSLMSSQIGVGLPVFLFLREASLGESGRWREALRRTAGFFFLAGSAAAVTLWVNWRPDAQAVAWFDHPLPHRILQAFGSLGWQAFAWVWPSGLAAFYPWRSGSIGFYAAAGLVLLLGFLMFAWRVRLRGGLILAGFAGFLACFLPVSGILALPLAFTADRLSYIPSLFLALALGAALDAGRKRGWHFPVYLCGAWALLLAPLTHRQATFWKSERSIVNRTLAEYPDSVPARINAAVLDGLEGKKLEALESFRKIRSAHPGNEVVWANEMTLLRELGRVSEAAAVGEQAVLAIPDSVPLRYQFGLLLEETGRKLEALSQFRRVRERSPNSVQPTYQCARLLVQLGEVKEAIGLLHLLERSMQGDPGYWDLRFEAHDRNGDWQEAAHARATAEALQPRQKSSP